ncbi:MAG: helix-turn-helix transcriptional regulator [Pseudomonadales bacterium]|nr:helix-turn-helix transcriptional regulator [Pseudomonadales bacterium]
MNSSNETSDKTDDAKAKQRRPVARKKPGASSKKKVQARPSSSSVASRRAATRKLSAQDEDVGADAPAGGSTISSTLEGLGALFEGVVGVSGAALQYAAGKTMDQASRVINSTPEQLERMGIAGRSLKDLRQVTGISLDELAGAIDMSNTDLLSAIEEGRAALPFEILLRLASFYARNNPLPFILKYARTYNPRISATLEKIGIDKLVIEAEREMQVVQIYRSRDAARQLSDEGFEKVRAFTEHAFDMALHFAASDENIELDEHAREHMHDAPKGK